ncbi:MAG: hypothetical protein IPN76_34945 [Saprospiraceae bacterium]|nr:hypothetical protein [Saprospiraceae bacterium]
MALLMPMQAAHIIGGTISYVCNGNGNYTFTMKIYHGTVDCQRRAGAFRW